MMEMPDLELLEQELEYERKKQQKLSFVKGIVLTLFVIVVCATLLTSLLFPVYSVNGTAMEPALSDESMVLTNKDDQCKAGDIIAFEMNDKIFMKRVIAVGGDTVDIDAKGNVSVNGKMLDESYLSTKATGICNIEFPYTVSEGTVFVLGDERNTSIDSRSYGAIDQDVIKGKVIFKILPITKIGFVK